MSLNRSAVLAFVAAGVAGASTGEAWSGSQGALSRIGGVPAFVALSGGGVGSKLRGGIAGELCPARPHALDTVMMAEPVDDGTRRHGAASDYLKRIPGHLQGLAIRNIQADLGTKRQGRDKKEYNGDGTPSLKDIQDEIDDDDDREFADIAMSVLDEEIDVSTFTGVRGTPFGPQNAWPPFSIFSMPFSPNPTAAV